MQLGLLTVAASLSWHATGNTQEVPNGIEVSVKVYNTRMIQNDIQTLAAKLGQVSVIDQSSLIAHLGALQGVTSSQFAMNLQATGAATPSTTTTTTNGTPSIAQTVGGTTSTNTPSAVQTVTPTPQVVQTVTSGPSGAGSTPGAPSGTQTVTTTVTNPAGTSSQIVTTQPSNTIGTSNQTVTTTPSNTAQTVTSTPSLTPTVPSLPAVTPLASPPTPNTSTLDLLGEQMQASYQIIGLRAFLQGAQSDDYTPGGKAKRHVTYGFPISITTPPGFENAAAEVEISVCNPDHVQDVTPPSVQMILPQEKTYNVAGLTSSSAGLGVGAVIASVINIGANFSWTHQTYYLVKQQDTVSVQRAHGTDMPTCSDTKDAATFGWQFRPVLRQKTIDQGPRMTYAQLAFSPPPDSPDAGAMNTSVAIRTCWRKYNRKTGIVGDRIANSCNPALGSPAPAALVPSAFDTLEILGIKAADNGNGTVSVTITGHFPAGTRVELGEAYLDESIPGFENDGKSIRFTATAQLLAVRGALLLSPDGSTKPLMMTGDHDEPINYQNDGTFVMVGHFSGSPILSVPGQRLKSTLERNSIYVPFTAPTGFTQEGQWRPELTLTRTVTEGSPPVSCTVPYAYSPARRATIRPYSDSLLEVSLPIWQCLEVGSVGVPQMYVAILGGRAFGLSDAPFTSNSPDEYTFRVPNSFLQGLTTVKLKRLFLDDQYEFTYRLTPPRVSVTGASLAGTTKLDATFALTGSGLDRVTLVYPHRQQLKCCGTYALLRLSARELASAKVLLLQPNDGGMAIPVALPAAKLLGFDADNSTVAYSVAIVQATKDHITYAISSDLGSAAFLKYADIKAPAATNVIGLDEQHLVFDVKGADAASTTVIDLKDAKGQDHGLLTLALPAPPKSGSDSTSKLLSLTEDKNGLAKGTTGSYSIKGSNLELITDVRYQTLPVSWHLTPDSSAVVIEQLPQNFTANVGKSTLVFWTSNGTTQTTQTTQTYAVPIH
jgi:hypothetical protein